MKARCSVLLSFSLFLVAAFAQAQISSADVLPEFQRLLRVQAKYLGRLPAPRTQSRSCEQRYDRLWKDGVLRVDWYYGYLNASRGGVVMDRMVRNEMIRALMRPCRDPDLGACGFRAISDQSKDMGPIRLTKKTSLGVVDIRLWNSAVKDSNSQNTDGIGPFTVSTKEQKEKTLRVRTAFFRSLSKTEVVIYEGHARGGAGPGFATYGIFEKIGAYLFKRDWKNVLKYLDASKTKPQVLMLGACETESYYLPTLRKRYPRTAVVATDRPQSFGANDQMGFSLVDSLIVGRCADEINEALTPQEAAGEGITKIHGF